MLKRKTFEMPGLSVVSGITSSDEMLDSCIASFMHLLTFTSETKQLKVIHVFKFEKSFIYQLHKLHSNICHMFY